MADTGVTGCYELVPRLRPKPDFLSLSSNTRRCLLPYPRQNTKAHSFTDSTSANIRLTLAKENKNILPLVLFRPPPSRKPVSESLQALTIFFKPVTKVNARTSSLDGHTPPLPIYLFRLTRPKNNCIGYSVPPFLSGTIEYLVLESTLSSS